MTDTLNGIGANASAEASTLPGSGIKRLEVKYNPQGDPNLRRPITLAWSAAHGYVDNAEPTKKFWWVTVSGVRYYWYQELSDATDPPTWQTKSSGTF